MSSSSGSSDDRNSKKKERLEQNRLSARESRKRKKVMIEELQRTLLSLSRENKELNEQNELLRRQLFDMASKYPNIIPIQSLLAITSDPMSNTESTQMHESSHQDANSAVHSVLAPTLSSSSSSNVMSAPMSMNHPSSVIALNSNSNNNLSELANAPGVQYTQTNNNVNIQPCDAALLANLLFRMSGAPLSAAPYFFTPTVQMRAATSAAQLANLEQQHQQSIGKASMKDGGEKNESVTAHSKNDA